MCKKLIYLSFFFAFCPMAMAYDIAFYVGAPNPGWYVQAQQNADVATIIARTGHMFKDIQQFDDTELVAFGAWVDKNTNDGEMDIIWLNGCTPSVLYPLANASPDGSRAEKWLDGGNMIINVADWFAYCTYEGGTRGGPGAAADNAGTGAANILDLSAGIIISADGTRFPVTADGLKYLPSLSLNNPFPTDRPVVLSAVAAPWEVAAIFAQNTAGTQADPVVIVNAKTGGYVAFINQATAPDDSIADRGVTCSEFLVNWAPTVLSGELLLKARKPSPADAQIGVTVGLLQWTGGATAVFHDVYLGTNPTPGPAEFKGRQTWLVYFDMTLKPGTTYYWRIDEVEADGTTIHTGDVWSFTIQPLIAWNPKPANGATGVVPAAQLRWSAGQGATKHHVYFGDNASDVDAGTGGTDKGIKTETTYATGPLYPETTYYWRVDESTTGATWLKGDLWSFTTAAGGSGVVREWWTGMGGTAVSALTGDPRYPDNPDGREVMPTFEGPVNWMDNYGSRLYGWLTPPETADYTFWIATDDYGELWLSTDANPANKVMIANVPGWVPSRDFDNTGGGAGGPSQKSAAKSLVKGQKYYIEGLMKEAGGGDNIEVAWQGGPITTRQILSGNYVSLAPFAPVRAYSPTPANLATNVTDTPTLRWKAGEKAAKHNVYFGTEQTAVTNATTASTGIYRGQQNLDVTSYVPTEVPLLWDTTYYWRIDEINPAEPTGPWKGIVWSFTTANYILVDEFEDYTGDVGSRIFQTWKDGWGYNEPPPGYGGNGTGSTVGNPDAPWVEQTMVHSGGQSMPLNYDNSGVGGKARYSETFREWATPQNWSRNNVKVLTLYFYGALANAAEQLYVALEDNAGHVKVVNHPDPQAAQKAGWQEWNIELTQFSAAGVNLAAVKRMYIGLGNRASPKVGGTGKIFIDDIRVYPSRCVASKAKPAADIAEPFDCKVAYEDLGVLADQWLFKKQLQDWQYRAAYWDGRYPFAWGGDGVAMRDGLSAAGYTILDADQLKTWMNARIADKKLSVVVFCRDIVPDTVCETMSDTCTLRKYLDAGGKIVWYADWPIYYQGHADNTSTTWGGAGATAVLGFNASSGPNDSNEPVVLTSAGVTWGLTTTWGSLRPTSPTITSNLTPLATISGGSAAAWAKHFVPGDTSRGFVRIWDRTGTTPPVADVISVAQSKGALPSDLNGDAVVDLKDFAVLADSWLEEVWWP